MKYLAYIIIIFLTILSVGFVLAHISYTTESSMVIGNNTVLFMSKSRYCELYSSKYQKIEYVDVCQTLANDEVDCYTTQKIIKIPCSDADYAAYINRSAGLTAVAINNNQKTRDYLEEINNLNKRVNFLETELCKVSKDYAFC